MTQAFLTVQLSLSGEFEAVVPHSSGERIVKLHPGHLEETISVLLRQQAAARAAGELRVLGTRSAPTQQELDHLRLHKGARVDTCPFCKGIASPSRRTKVLFEQDLGGGVKLRRFAPSGGTRPSKRTASQAPQDLSLEDLGL